MGKWYKYNTEQLGGTTGDTYGFVVEVTEVLLLLIYIIISVLQYSHIPSVWHGTVYQSISYDSMPSDPIPDQS